MIPNMADLALFEGETQGPTWRSKMGVPDDAMVVVHVGAMGFANDLGQLLDVAGLLRDSGIYFAILGTGSERSSLEARAKAEGLESVLFDGPYPRSQVPWVLKGADVGFLCFRHEPVLYSNSANKFGDYLAAGLPVVVTYPGWQSKLLERYGGGLAATLGPKDVAAQLLRLRDDPLLRERLSTGSRRLACERFARDRLVVQFEQVLCRAAGAAGLKAGLPGYMDREET